jgi:hypothetical protein
VLYAVAFLSQVKSGPTKEAFDRLINRLVFSYGITDKRGQLQLQKPDGSVGLVDFAYLAGNAPEPFKTEWSGGKGINVHHKFVVIDFSLPTAKVFTGSSNLAPSGEKGAGSGSRRRPVAEQQQGESGGFSYRQLGCSEAVTANATVLPAVPCATRPQKGGRMLGVDGGGICGDCS